MQDNLIQMKKKQRQLGINVSFTISCGETQEEKIQAQVYMERFHDLLQRMRLEEFPRLTATVTSRQEYLP